MCFRKEPVGGLTRSTSSDGDVSHAFREALGPYVIPREVPVRGFRDNLRRPLQ